LQDARENAIASNTIDVSIRFFIISNSNI